MLLSRLEVAMEYLLVFHVPSLRRGCTRRNIETTIFSQSNYFGLPNEH